jgi:hypothetical protein
MNLLEDNILPIDRSQAPLVLPWPGNPVGLRTFSMIAEWREFIHGLGLHPAIPQIVSLKFQRAQKLYFLAWIEFDAIKAGAHRIGMRSPGSLWPQDVRRAAPAHGRKGRSHRREDSDVQQVWLADRRQPV